jgi:hypothetical protein
MLFLETLSEIFRHVPKNGVGLTGLTPLKQIAHKWSWMIREADRAEWFELLRIVSDRYQYDREPYACLAGAACLPREFLDRYAEIDIPELGHDELRMPLFAQIFGLKLYDTGFYKWFDKDEEQFFSPERRSVKTHTIKRELAQPTGRRVFHPYYRKVFLASEAPSWLEAISAGRKTSTQWWPPFLVLDLYPTGTNS